MKNMGKQSRRTRSHSAKFDFRYFIVSATIGLMIGLFEAALLWITPRVIPLQVPDVGWVIWFLAPLVDMASFGLLGLLLGWLARRGARKEVLVAVQAGFPVAFVLFELTWFHVEFGIVVLQAATVSDPLGMLALGTGLSLVVVESTYGLLAARVAAWIDFLMKPLAWGLAAAMLAAVAGIGVFLVRPSFYGTAARATSPPSGAPNIVFITLDTVRADHLSGYGYGRPTTPNLDRFARTGVLFENAIAPTSWTLASHASMFTGLLPQQDGTDWAVPLASSPWTLAEIFRSRGYQTAGFTANFLYLQKGWGIAQGFEHYEDGSAFLRHNLADTLLGASVIQPVYQRFVQFDYFDREDAGQLNRRIFRWYRQRSQRPFFVFINYFDAHEPYMPPAPFNRRFGKTSTEAARLLHQEGGAPQLTPGERESLVDGYDNSLAYIDSQVGNLLRFFRQSPDWQNTIVIITSDHGEEFGVHGSYGHGPNLYREVLHIPLMVAGPGVPKGLRISHLVGARQLFATVLDLAGYDNSPFSRYSLARFWNASYKPAPADNAVVSELVPINDPGAQRAMISLTTPEWQYIEHRDGYQELYRWTSDPDEKENLAGSPQERATLESLRPRLVNLVSGATRPWLGPEYLQALEKAADLSRLSLLCPQPLQPGAPDTPSRIGIAQAYFKSRESTPTQLSQAERNVLKSLPYQ